MTELEENKPHIRFQGDDLAFYGPYYSCLDKFIHQKSENQKFLRFYPRDYSFIRQILEQNDIPIESNIPYKLEEFALPNDINLQLHITLYPFQSEALNAWLNNNYCGIIILPTGAGKTIVACAIINELKIKTLIVVPTIVLMEQWKNQLIDTLGLKDQDIGMFGGGEQSVKPITISTYNSASLYLRRLRAQFGLLIIDEAHHLTGTSNETIADGYIAPARLAITATLTPNDPALEVLMSKGFNRIIYQKIPSELQNQEIISPYKLISIIVPSTAESSTDYKEKISIFTDYLNKNRLFGPNAFELLTMRVNRDPEAYRALQAYKEAKKLAFVPIVKLKEVEKLLISHKDDKTIIFSDYIDFCEQIGREFFIPVLTHRTSKNERSSILNLFRNLPNAKICVGKIFDEGIDIPSATIGIIVSGSGHPRQFIQRLGRLLRPHPNKGEAILYEIISSETLEEKTSRRRKRNF